MGTNDVALIVPAAGEGVRLGSPIPKALAPARGVPLVRRAVDRFDACPNLVEVVIAVPDGHEARFEQALRARSRHMPEPRLIVGGATRQESVAIALEALTTEPRLVCVHDAARPLVSMTTIEAVIAAASRSGAATAASRPTDSVREDVDDGATRALDRTKLWLVETPQVFFAGLLRQAHRRARERGVSATDDATLVECLCAHAVSVVVSDGPNPKVTTRADLEMVALLCDSTPAA